METYVLRFTSDNVTVFDIGRGYERESVPSSAGLLRNFQAENDESATRQAKLFLNGFEEGSRTFGIGGENYFKRVNKEVILLALAPEERKIDFTYYSLFEGFKEEIRTNLRKAKEERLERLRREKEELERQIKEQEAEAIPILFYKK